MIYRACLGKRKSPVYRSPVYRGLLYLQLQKDLVEVNIEVDREGPSGGEELGYSHCVTTVYRPTLRPKGDGTVNI